MLADECVTRRELRADGPLDFVPVVPLVHQLHLRTRHQPCRHRLAVHSEARAQELVAHRRDAFGPLRMLAIGTAVRQHPVVVEQSCDVRAEIISMADLSRADGEPRLAVCSLFDGEEYSAGRDRRRWRIRVPHFDLERRRGAHSPDRRH